jgi:hypothetical protein
VITASGRTHNLYFFNLDGLSRDPVLGDSGLKKQILQVLEEIAICALSV